MKILNVILIVALVVVPLGFGRFSMPTEMALSVVAISLALCFTNLDKFAEFKGAGFEAKLKKAVDKTYAAIDELKELALSLSAPIVDGLAISGRMMQYIPIKDKLERVEKIKATLKKLGASGDEINEACSTIYERIQNDYLERILRSLKEGNEQNLSLFDDFENWKLDDWDLERIEKFISTNSLTQNDETKEWIKDFKYFLTHKKIRKYDKWQG